MPFIKCKSCRTRTIFPSNVKSWSVGVCFECRNPPRPTLAEAVRLLEPLAREDSGNGYLARQFIHRATIPDVADIVHNFEAERT